MFSLFKNKLNAKIIAIDFCIFFMICAFGYTTYEWYFNNNNDNLIGIIMDNNYKEKVAELKQINSDVIGILEVPNTEFKSVLVKAPDNNYYLKKNVYKQTDRDGTPFLDYRTNLNSNKLIIYGHNSRFRNMPFNYLMNYYDEDFYKENKYLEIKTDNEILRYEIFSVFTELSDWTYADVEFDTEESYIKNIESIKEKSIYKNDFDINDKQILVLQTCSTKKEYLKYKKKFLIIAAGRVI